MAVINKYSKSWRHRYLISPSARAQVTFQTTTVLEVPFLYASDFYSSLLVCLSALIICAPKALAEGGF
jgi:hypothetical protein